MTEENIVPFVDELFDIFGDAIADFKECGLQDELLAEFKRRMGSIEIDA
jgi:hypothetical protein